MDLNEFGKPGVYKEGIKAQEDKENGNCAQQKGQHPTCTENTSSYLEEFLNRTTIHGFNYLGERGRTLPEKLWWLVIIIAALYLCISQIMQTYDKWMNSPVIVTFATTQTPIWEVPFPAITICPEIKSKKTLFNYTDMYLKSKNGIPLTPAESRDFHYIGLVCGIDKKLLNSSITTTDERALDFLNEVAPDMKDIFFEVQWRGVKYSGEELRDLFVPMFTSEGICYTFNLMDRTEIFTDVITHYKDCFSTNGKYSKWSIESGYSEDADLDSYPRRTLIAGTKGGLDILFHTPDEDIDYVCGDSLQGYKVSLHHPAEIPRIKQKYIRIPLDESVIASIRPNMMSTAGELVNYKPEDRKCYFSDERHLEFFNIYNQENCLLECMTNYIHQTCGCVGFQLPRRNSTPICGATKRGCIEQCKADFLASEVSSKIKEAQKNSKHKREDAKQDEPSVSEKCNCLPSCNSLDFDVESSQCEWDWKSLFDVQRQTVGWNKTKTAGAGLNKNSHFSRLQLFFKDMQFITSERNELYGQTEFWANCGGLLGLFAGFSFISAFEIFYFLTLRLVCNVRKFGRHYWSGNEKLLEAKGL